LFFFFFTPALTYAQETDSTLVEEDFSLYGEAELAGGGKRFCTSKVFDQSPNKLISFGYDFQGSHTMSLASTGTTAAGDFSVKLQANRGLYGDARLVHSFLRKARFPGRHH